MTRNSVRALLVAAAAPFFVSALSNLALAQPVSFVATWDFAAGTYPRGVAVGDFNGGGVRDVAVANYGSNTVSVRLGNGDGTFQAAQDFAVGGGPNSVAAADFNGDGKL